MENVEKGKEAPSWRNLTNEKNAEINQKQGNHPFGDPELRTRSEIETQSRSPQGQRRKRMWKNEKRNERNKAKENNNLFENTAQTVSNARSRD